MVIYAIFLCMQITGQCQQVEADRYSLGEWLPGTTYQSLEDCQFSIHRGYAQNRSPDKNGHFMIAKGMWYECLSRHVDTWEQPQQ